MVARLPIIRIKAPGKSLASTASWQYDRPTELTGTRCRLSTDALMTPYSRALSSACARTDHMHLAAGNGRNAAEKQTVKRDYSDPVLMSDCTGWGEWGGGKGNSVNIGDVCTGSGLALGFQLINFHYLNVPFLDFYFNSFMFSVFENWLFFYFLYNYTIILAGPRCLQIRFTGPYVWINIFRFAFFFLTILDF